MRNASLLLLVLLAPLAAQPDRFGLPACSGPDQELAPKHAFIVCHSGLRKAPVWTVHELSAVQPASRATRRTGFRRDRSPSMPGASSADYANSGFSRGHLVPAGDVSGDEQALRDSFLLSNTVPQNSAANRSAWRRLENRVRKLAGQADSVIVVTGVIFPENPQRIGSGGVAVPTELYKVILVTEGSRVDRIAFLMPNADTGRASLESFIVTGR